MPQRKRQRLSNEINSGSMADIAFLLLIFFLVTTTIASDKGIAMLLPPKPEDDQPPPEVKKSDRNIFKIQANSKDMLLVEEEPLDDVKELKTMVKTFVLNFGDPSEKYKALYNTLPTGLQSYIEQNGRSPESSDDPAKAIVSFKADRGTSYDLYIQVLDQLNAAYNEIYAERVGLTVNQFLNLNKSKPEDKALFNKAKEQIPRAISIAEPSKIGG